jgi:hypothetical protein
VEEDNAGPVLSYTDQELRELAEDVVANCPSLTQLLLSLIPDPAKNPVAGLN